MNHNLRIGDEVFIAENATLLGDVTIGDRSGVWFGAVLRGDRDRIVIGAGSNIQDNATVHCSTGHPTIIGGSRSATGRSSTAAPSPTRCSSAWVRS